MSSKHLESIWKKKKSYKYFSRKLNKIVSVKKHGQHYQMRIGRTWADVKPKEYGLVTQKSADLLGWLDKKSLNELTKDLKGRTPDNMKIYITRMKRSKNLEEFSKHYKEMEICRINSPYEDNDEYERIFNDKYQEDVAKFLEAKFGEIEGSSEFRNTLQGLRTIISSAKTGDDLSHKVKKWSENNSEIWNISGMPILGFPDISEKFYNRLNELRMNDISKAFDLNDGEMKVFKEMEASNLEILARGKEFELKELGSRLKNLDPETKDFFIQKLVKRVGGHPWYSGYRPIGTIQDEIDAKIKRDKLFSSAGIKRKSLLLMTDDEIEKLSKINGGKKIRNILLEEARAFSDETQYRSEWSEHVSPKLHEIIGTKYPFQTYEIWKLSRELKTQSKQKIKKITKITSKELMKEIRKKKGEGITHEEIKKKYPFLPNKEIDDAVFNLHIEGLIYEPKGGLYVDLNRSSDYSKLREKQRKKKPVKKIELATSKQESKFYDVLSQIDAILHFHGNNLTKEELKKFRYKQTAISNKYFGKRGTDEKPNSKGMTLEEQKKTIDSLKELKSKINSTLK